MNRMMKIMMNCKTNLRPAVMIFFSFRLQNFLLLNRDVLLKE